MSVMRKVLLAGSQSPWLRDRATKARFVRKAVSRFMPGEGVADALDACQTLHEQGASTIVTHLGENLERLEDAEAVEHEYVACMREIQRRGLPTEVSVKLTQLGLDHDTDACLRHLLCLGEEAERLGNFLWIDMEASNYVDVTLDLYKRLRGVHPRSGLCLQAYLRRTERDLENLLPVGPAIRLVKGAYLEPATLAFGSKKEVDEQYFALATRLLSSEARASGSFVGLATHDPSLIGQLERHIDQSQTPSSSYEFEMLYGIQRGEQRRLAGAQRPLRVLISYGESWFPWYMRRLAERPANVWFVAKNLFS